MGHYQTRPVQVEAIQWNEHGDHSAVRECDQETFESLTGTVSLDDLSKYGILKTSKIEQIVVSGDWIISDPEHQYIICKPDDFSEAYNLVIPGEIVEFEGQELKPFCAENTSVNNEVAGGHVNGNGFTIVWHDWTQEPKPKPNTLFFANGAFIEDVIAACIKRLEFYQGSDFANEYNEKAIALLNQAIQVLNDRTAERQERGVEGTHQV